MIRFCSLLAVLLAACADAPDEDPVDSDRGAALGGTARMVERLAEIEAGVDRRQSQFASDARVEELLARGPGPGLQGRMTFAGQLSEMLLYAGRFEEATDSMKALLEAIDAAQGRVPPEFRGVIAELEAVALLKWEEQLDCVEARLVDRCLLPVIGAESRPAAAPGREAVRAFERLLAVDPGNAGYRWLLNLAYMLLGEYPDGVPDEWLIAPATFAAEHDLGRFPNRAVDVGLDATGHAGGAVMDDFDRDGDLDVMVSGWLLQDQVQYFENDGRGAFIERTDAAGLTGIVGGLNLKQADFDNDGFLDVLVLRGAWMSYGQPNSLLRNRGDGTFEDVTEAAGLLDAYSTQTADWADYDGDGWLDLYVGNESVGRRRNPNQLFHNNGDGTFSDVAAAVGADVVGFTKGVAWGDYDNDGDPDLYISLMREPNVLLANEGPVAGGGWSFQDVTSEAGVAEPVTSFPVWFWDFDNDGWLDLYASGYLAQVGDVAAEHLGQPHDALVPRLYRNNRDGTFTDVAASAEIDKIQYVMGSNYGDLDSDGYPDFYVGTGDPVYESMMANRMFRNDAGLRFQEVTSSGGFGHVQKGHGVSFGDVDNDGDQDIMVNMGGASPSDLSRNVLFENPGHGHHWVTLRLEGVTSNRDGLGSRVRVLLDMRGDVGELNKLVGGGGSFGANSLQQEIGLGVAVGILEIAITWPATGRTDVYVDVEMDRIYRVVEGGAQLEPLTVSTLSLGSGR
jgi:hypothetical protein